MKAPCKDCPNVGCGPYHDECEPYQEYVKKRQARQGAVNTDYLQYKQDAVLRKWRRDRW
jgi:hypothetical protein